MTPKAKTAECADCGRTIFVGPKRCAKCLLVFRANRERNREAKAAYADHEDIGAFWGGSK